MKILYNEPLSKYTSIKIGGTAKNMYFPQTTEELIKVVKDVGLDRLIGGGSNLLINERKFENVICLREFDNHIIYKGDGEYEVGASVRLQRLIKEINSNGYGGIEYLFSVPGLVGGAVLMNAGGSLKQGWSISDYITSVKVLYKGEVLDIPKVDCAFSHRQSIFKEDREFLILSVTFKFEKGLPEEFNNKCLERMQYCKETQDNTKPNFGSVFKKCDGHIMEFFRRYLSNNKNNIHFSSKTRNWIINEGGGHFKEAYVLIKRVVMIHKILNKECSPEVIIWE